MPHHSRRVLRRPGSRAAPRHSIVIKDNIETADRMMTTAGSLAMVGARPLADARLVTALRAAGVIILGKTNNVRVGPFQILVQCAQRLEW